MSYISQINAFERLMRESPLPPAAQLLWYKLMQRANLEFWPETISVTNGELIDLLAGASIHTAMDARKALIDAGLIEFRPGVKGTPSVYRLIPIREDRKQTPEEIMAVLAGPERPEDIVGDYKIDMERYIGYTAEMGHEVREITRVLFEEFMPGVKPTEHDAGKVFEHITEYFNDGDEQSRCISAERKGLLTYAFEIARSRRALNWSYIDAILRNFREQGIADVDEAMRRQEKWARKGDL